MDSFATARAELEDLGYVTDETRSLLSAEDFLKLLEMTHEQD